MGAEYLMREYLEVPTAPDAFKELAEKLKTIESHNAPDDGALISLLSDVHVHCSEQPGTGGKGLRELAKTIYGRLRLIAGSLNDKEEGDRIMNNVDKYYRMYSK